MGFLKKSVTAATEWNGGGRIGALARALSSGLYVGYVPAAQGTIGSLWGPVVCFFVPNDWLPAVWLLIPVLFFAGVWASTLSERYWGHDPGRVVIDEVLGSFVALAFLPVNIPTLCAGFLLFRAFDILKPPPIRSTEKLPHGWGVMTDDLAAGIAANIVLRIIMHVFPGIF